MIESMIPVNKGEMVISHRNSIIMEKNIYSVHSDHGNLILYH